MPAGVPGQGAPHRDVEQGRRHHDAGHRGAPSSQLSSIMSTATTPSRYNITGEDDALCQSKCATQIRPPGQFNGALVDMRERTLNKDPMQSNEKR
ncbi:MAG TPA: hypothetical protein VGO47_01365 [Chlamydiales bacterium]|nr:hypothetical protein [Chlamydiales bacterium]